jgi:hypothetical protein
MGTHESCWGSESDPLPVREVAMMIIMDRLMDKENWHKKVFDEEIMAKWRKEALEYPDKQLWEQATGGKSSTWIRPSMRPEPLTGIMSNDVFDYVSMFHLR